MTAFVPVRAWVAFALLLLVAAGLQTSLAPRLLLLGSQPDFVFAVVIAGALLADAATGAMLGFAGGLVSAALVGDTVGTLLVSRTLAGFAAGQVGARLFRTSALVIVAGAALAFLVAAGTFALCAPAVFARNGTGPAVGSVVVGLFWNALLVFPITLLLRRLGWGPGEPA